MQAYNYFELFECDTCHIYKFETKLNHERNKGKRVFLEKFKTLDNIRRSRVELTKGLHSSRLIRIIDQVQHFTMALQQKTLNGVVLVTIPANLVKVSHKLICENFFIDFYLP